MKLLHKQFSPILKVVEYKDDNIPWILWYRLSDDVCQHTCLLASMAIFGITATHLLGTVTYLKHMARLLNGNLGLQMMVLI